MNKNVRILKWLLILLVVLNIGAIGTIIYLTQKQNKLSDESILIGSGNSVSVLNGRFFRITAGFSEVQMDSFRNANQSFRPVARDISTAIDSLKSRLFTELNKTQPDTALLSNMALQIGKLHGQLKYQTNQFYLNILSICTPAQKKIIEEAFLPLFKSETLAFPGHGQHRQGFNSQ